ncbi:acyltransferase domain-containing protein [Micromonospora sp. M12]
MYPVFAAALDEVWAQFGRTFEDELHDTANAQPALFAIEVALYRLAESLGIRPDFLIGHSVGRSPQRTCRGVVAGGRVHARRGAGPLDGRVAGRRRHGRGAGWRGRGRPDVGRGLSIAAVNGPRAVVVSGDLGAIESWLPQWQHRKTTRLAVSHAFHSHLMEPMLAEFRRIVEGLQFHQPQIPIAAGDVTDPEYWVRHVRDAVRFADGIKLLHGQGVTRFLELGPDAVLTAMAAQTLDDDGLAFIPSLRAGRDEPQTFAAFLGQVHLAGIDLDWQAVLPGARQVALPTYAFQHQRYWLTRAVPTTRRPPARADRAPAVGRCHTRR